jgi:hypothetical protein
MRQSCSWGAGLHSQPDSPFLAVSIQQLPPKAAAVTRSSSTSNLCAGEQCLQGLACIPQLAPLTSPPAPTPTAHHHHHQAPWHWAESSSHSESAPQVHVRFSSSQQQPDLGSDALQSSLYAPSHYGASMRNARSAELESAHPGVLPRHHEPAPVSFSLIHSSWHMGSLEAEADSSDDDESQATWALLSQRSKAHNVAQAERRSTEHFISIQVRPTLPSAM